MKINVKLVTFARVTEWHLRRILRWVHPKDLEGLESIVVIDDCPDDPEYVKTQPYLRGFLYNGHYEKKKRHSPARVVLYSNDIYWGIPKLFWVSPTARLKIARTLFHEIGHHVIATRGYINEPHEKYKPWDGSRSPYEEEMADSYASNAMTRMLRAWPYKFGRLVARGLSTLYFKAGIQDYWDGNYQSAAALQFRAHSLNRQNEEAGQCYRHAMEQLKQQAPSPLTDAERQWLKRRYSHSALST